VLLGDTGGISGRVSRGAGVDGVKYKRSMVVALECFCASLARPRLRVTSSPCNGTNGEHHIHHRRLLPSSLWARRCAILSDV
jgi:hypothetical protein